MAASRAVCQSSSPRAAERFIDLLADGHGRSFQLSGGRFSLLPRLGGGTQGLLQRLNLLDVARRNVPTQRGRLGGWFPRFGGHVGRELSTQGFDLALEFTGPPGFAGGPLGLLRRGGHVRRLPEPALVDLELLDFGPQLLAPLLQLAYLAAAGADVVFAHLQPPRQVVGQIRRFAERLQLAQAFDPLPQPVADRRSRVGDAQTVLQVGQRGFQRRDRRLRFL